MFFGLKADCYSVHLIWLSSVSTYTFSIQGSKITGSASAQLCRILFLPWVEKLVVNADSSTFCKKKWVQWVSMLTVLRLIDVAVLSSCSWPLPEWGILQRHLWTMQWCILWCLNFGCKAKNIAPPGEARSFINKSFSLLGSCGRVDSQKTCSGMKSSQFWWRTLH